jgi:RNA polymerase sporulation-specific sigma factor
MDSVNFFSFISMCAHRKVLTAVKLSRRLHSKTLNDAISMDAPLSGEDERTLSSILMDNCDNPEEVFGKNDSLAHLEKILTSRLSETEMTVLRDFAEGYTYEEISTRIGKNKKTIDNALWRARKKLANTLPC